jgi:hypothetical protein
MKEPGEGRSSATSPAPRGVTQQPCAGVVTWSYEVGDVVAAAASFHRANARHGAVPGELLRGRYPPEGGNGAVRPLGGSLLDAMSEAHRLRASSRSIDAIDGWTVELSIPCARRSGLAGSALGRESPGATARRRSPDEADTH